MRLFFFAISFSLTFAAWSSTRTVARIHHLDYGDQMADEILVYLSDGRIARLSSFELDKLERLHRAVQTKKLFSLDLDELGEITRFKVVDEIPKQRHEQVKFIAPYTPSIIGKMETARKFFYESLPSPNESQCFNRAQVWTHEWRIKYNLYSNKVWLFFTRSYIRKYAFEWWFHVSPMVFVVEDGKVRERVMDVKYSRGPVKLKQWTDIFLKDDAACPVVEKYSDQANYPEHGSCFVMKSSMYYYQPADLESLELFNIERTTWIPTEVVEAYREAFNIDLKGAGL